MNVPSPFPLSTREEMYVTSSPKCLQHNHRKTGFNHPPNPLETGGVKLTRGFLSLAVNMTVCANSLVERAAMYSGLLELYYHQGLFYKCCPTGWGQKDAQGGTWVHSSGSSKVCRLEDWPTALTYFSFIRKNGRQNKQTSKNQKTKNKTSPIISFAILFFYGILFARCHTSK